MAMEIKNEEGDLRGNYKVEGEKLDFKLMILDGFGWFPCGRVGKPVIVNHCRFCKRRQAGGSSEGDG